MKLVLCRFGALAALPWRRYEPQPGWKSRDHVVPQRLTAAGWLPRSDWQGDRR